MRPPEDGCVYRRVNRDYHLPKLQFIGKKDDLIRGGFATEFMLRVDPRDNGFGITQDEYGRDVTVWENYLEEQWGPGFYSVDVWLVGAGIGEKIAEDSLDSVDISSELGAIGFR